MKPTLYFNFADTPFYLDPRITYVRNSIGTYVASDGAIVVAPANAPRWTFHPTTSECLGVLIEGEGSNRALYSEQFDNAAWQKDSTVSVTVNAIMAPDNNTTAERITASTSNPVIYQTASVISGREVLTFSVFAKADSVSFARLSFSNGSALITVWYDLVNQTVANGDITGAGTLQFIKSGIEPFQNGWSRCAVTIAATGTSTVSAIISPAETSSGYGVVNNSIFVWGAQLEDASADGTNHGASSYIPTTAATVTRNADNYYIDIAPATDTWFNSNEGSLFFTWISKDVNTYGLMYYGGIGNDSNNYISLGRFISPTIVTARFVASAVVTEINKEYAFPTNEIGKAAIAWDSAQAVFTVNAALPTAVAVNATPVTTTRMTIGYDPSETTASSKCAYATLQSFAYYRNKMDIAHMMLVTS